MRPIAMLSALVAVAAGASIQDESIPSLVGVNLSTYVVDSEFSGIVLPTGPPDFRITLFLQDGAQPLISWHHILG